MKSQILPLSKYIDAKHWGKKEPANLMSLFRLFRISTFFHHIKK